MLEPGATVAFSSQANKSKQYYPSPLIITRKGNPEDCTLTVYGGKTDLAVKLLHSLLYNIESQSVAFRTFCTSEIHFKDAVKVLRVDTLAVVLDFQNDHSIFFKTIQFNNGILRTPKNDRVFHQVFNN